MAQYLLSAASAMVACATVYYCGSAVDELQKAEGELKRLRQLHDTAGNELKKAKSEYERLKQSHSTTENELKKAKSDYERRKQSHSTTENELKKAKSDYESLKQLYELSLAENEDLKHRVCKMSNLLLFMSYPTTR
jgi:chromosome segregation ATPase